MEALPAVLQAATDAYNSELQVEIVAEFLSIERAAAYYMERMRLQQLQQQKLVRKHEVDHMFAAQQTQCEERVKRQRAECALRIADATEEYATFKMEMERELQKSWVKVQTVTAESSELNEKIQCEQLVVLSHAEGEVLRSHTEFAGIVNQVQQMCERSIPLL